MFADVLFNIYIFIYLYINSFQCIFVKLVKIILDYMLV